MTITLTQKEERELWAEAATHSLKNPEPDEFICQLPRQLGKGYVRNIEVYPHLWLMIWNCESQKLCPLHIYVLLIIILTSKRFQPNLHISHSSDDKENLSSLVEK